MKSFCVFAAVVLCCSSAVSAAPKIFVSSNGVDANNGSRNSPKRSLQAAHDSVDIGGEIVILDTAGYGPVSISKDVAVVVPPGVSGFSTVAGNASAIAINAPQSNVAIRGLILEGGGAASSGAGISVTNVGQLVVEDTTIRNFGAGIQVTTAAAANLAVRRVTIRNSGYGLSMIETGSQEADATVDSTSVDGATNAALYVSASGTGSAYMSASRCRLSNNAIGIEIATGTSTASADACEISGSGYAFFSASNAGTINTRSNNTLSNNGQVINGSNVLSALSAY
mgnify:CR=1 FL=1